MRSGRYSKSGLNRLGGVVQSSLEALGLRHRILEHQALDAWASVVGPQIAAVTVPEKVRDGQLFVACKSSMWANELTLHARDIANKLNAEVRKKVIKEIRFSARGYKRADEARRKERAGGEARTPANVELDEADLQAADQVASHASSEELAEIIRRAVIAGRKMKKSKEEDKPTASE